MKRLAIPPLVLALLAPATTGGEEVVRRVGRVSFRADTKHAFPGGIVVARLGVRGGRIGAAWAIVGGRRAPFFADRGLPRALVPVSADSEPGPATMGVELAARGGDQRIPVPITLPAREYPARRVFLGGPKRALYAQAGAGRDSRRLLAALRAEGGKAAPGPLRPPVAGTGRGFGEPRLHAGLADAESRIDGLAGERHRGLDYPVPIGTPVRSPGAGTVLLAEPLVLSGGTVVIDHGQGVRSVLLHLSRTDVRAGDAVAAGAAVGLSGDTGVAPEPMLEWRTYLHGTAVDPLVLAAVLDGL